MLKHLALISLLLFSLAVSAQKDTNSTFHLKKPADSVLPKERNIGNSFMIQAGQRQPIHLTICGKDSGEITIAELKKCKGIVIGGWTIVAGISTGFKPDDIIYFNPKGDNVTSFELCAKHLKALTILRASNALLTNDMVTLLKNISPGDSLFIRNVQYNDAVKGPSSLPPIQFKVVKKEIAVKNKE